MGLCCCLWPPLARATRAITPVSGLPLVGASLISKHRLSHLGLSSFSAGLSSCGSAWAQAQLLRGMWAHPGPGIESTFPPLTGRFFPFGSEEVPSAFFLTHLCHICLPFICTYLMDFLPLCFQLVYIVLFLVFLLGTGFLAVTRFEESASHSWELFSLIMIMFNFFLPPYFCALSQLSFAFFLAFKYFFHLSPLHSCEIFTIFTLLMETFKLKIYMLNIYIYMFKIHRYRKQTCGYQRREREEGGTNQECRINRYKLLHIKQTKQQEYTIQHKELQPFML